MLPVDRYVAGLARKRMAAGVLFLDSEDRVLLVEPSYKPNREILGGAVEPDESPWATAVREMGKPVQQITTSLLRLPTAKSVSGLQAFARRTGVPVA